MRGKLPKEKAMYIENYLDKKLSNLSGTTGKLREALSDMIDATQD